MSSTSVTPIFRIGLDVHKDSVTAAFFRNRDAEPMRVDERLSLAGTPLPLAYPPHFEIRVDLAARDDSLEEPLRP